MMNYSFILIPSLAIFLAGCIASDACDPCTETACGALVGRWHPVARFGGADIVRLSADGDKLYIAHGIAPPGRDIVEKLQNQSKEAVELLAYDPLNQQITSLATLNATQSVTGFQATNGQLAIFTDNNSLWWWNGHLNALLPPANYTATEFLGFQDGQIVVNAHRVPSLSPAEPWSFDTHRQEWQKGGITFTQNEITVSDQHKVYLGSQVLFDSPCNFVTSATSNASDLYLVVDSGSWSLPTVVWHRPV